MDNVLSRVAAIQNNLKKNKNESVQQRVKDIQTRIRLTQPGEIRQSAEDQRSRFDVIKFERGATNILLDNNTLGTYKHLDSRSQVYDKYFREHADEFESIAPSLDELEEARGIINAGTDLTRARTGDRSVLNTPAASDADFEEYLRLLNLSEYDRQDIRFRQPMDESMQIKATTQPFYQGMKFDYDLVTASKGAQTYEDLMNLNMTYTLEEIQRDAQAVEDYMYGRENADKIAAVEASHRLSARFGDGYKLANIRKEVNDRAARGTTLNVGYNAEQTFKQQQAALKKYYDQGNPEEPKADAKQKLSQNMQSIAGKLLLPDRYSDEDYDAAMRWMQENYPEFHDRLKNADKTSITQTVIGINKDFEALEFEDNGMKGWMEYVNNRSTYIPAEQRKAYVEHETAQMEDKYGWIDTAPDFETMSQPLTFSRNQYGGGLTEDQELYMQIVPEDGLYRKSMYSPFVNGDGFGDSTKSDLLNIGTDYEKKGYQYMEERERKRYAYLYREAGPEAAREYLDDLAPLLLERRNTENAKYYVSAADKYPIAANIAGFGAGLMNAPAGALNMADTLLTGKEKSAYDPIFDNARLNETVTARTKQNIEEATQGVELLGVNIPAALYSAGTSSLTSLANAAIFGPIGAVAAPALSSFNTEYMHGLEEQKSQWDAFWDATVDGLIEAGTEVFSVGALFDETTSALKYFAQNLITEPVEEVLGDIARAGYESAKYGEDPITRRADELVQRGYDPHDALTQAAKDYGHSLFETALTSMLSGGMAAVPGTVGNASANRQLGGNIQENNTAQSILGVGSTMSKLSPETKQMIDMEMKALQNGKGSSKARLGRIYRDMMKNLDEWGQDVVMKAMAEDISRELANRGADEGQRALADSIARITADNGTATKEDFQAVKQSRMAVDMINELTAAAKMRKTAETVESPAVETVENPDADGQAEKSGRLASEWAMGVWADNADKIAATREAMRNVARAAVKKESPAAAKKAPEGTAEEAAVEPAEEAVPVDASDEFDVEAEAIDAEIQEAEERAPVELSDELTVEYSEENADQYRLAKYAEVYGKNGDIMFRNYKDGDVRAYAKAFQKAVQYGRDGFNREVVSEYESLSDLSKEQIGIAYELGRASRIAQAKPHVNAAGVTVGKVDYSGLKPGTLMGLRGKQRAGVTSAARFAEVCGFNLKLVESVADADGVRTGDNGAWDGSTMTLTLDVYAGSNSLADLQYAVGQTLGHELTHFAKQFADSEAWNDYQDFVLGYLSTKNSESELNDEIGRRIGLAKSQNETLTREDAIEEIVADASSEALGQADETVIQRLAEKNPNLVKRLADRIRKWVADIKKRLENAFSGEDSRNRVAVQMRDTIDELSERWLKLMENAVENRWKAGETQAEVDTQPTSIAYTHIDARTPESVRNTDKELFCSNVEEAQIGYAAAAQMLLSDLNSTVPGQKFFTGDSVTGQKRMTSAMLAKIKDSTGWTWARIQNSLEQFAAMSSSEELPKNTVTNREMELYLDSILSEGYTAIDGTKVSPWDEYIEAKNRYEGAENKIAPESTYDGAVEFGEYAFADSYGVKYSARAGIEFVEDKYYSRLIDNIEKQKDGAYVRVGAVQNNSILHRIGMPIESIYFDVSKIRTAMLNHADHITADVLKQIPSILRDPVVITEANVANTINVFGDLWINDSPVMVGVMIATDRSGRNVINKIRTVHARRDYMDKITDENTLYLNENKKRTRDWFQARGNVVPLGGTNFGFIRSIARNDDTVKTSKRDPYALSDRELLANAYEGLAVNDAERDFIKRYKGAINDIMEIQRKINASKDRIAELQQDRKGNRDEIIKEQNRLKIYNNQLLREDGRLLKLEASKPIQTVVQRERAQLKSTVRRDTRARIEERNSINKYRAKIIKDTSDLRTWLTTPTNKAHVPEALREPLAGFLEALDFRSKRSLRGGAPTKADKSLADAMDRLQGALANARKHVIEGTDSPDGFMGFIDLPGDFIEKFDDLRRSIKDMTGNESLTGMPIAEMNGAQLRALSEAVAALNKSIREVNSLLASSRFKTVTAAAGQTVNALEKVKAKTTGSAIGDAIRGFLDWQNATPFYAFKRFGEAGRDIFNGLMDGWDKLARLSKKLIEFTDETYKPEEVRAWAKEIKTVELSGDRRVQMTTAQLMSLYCLNKREQARGHLYGGGIRIADVKGARGRRIRQADNYTLTQADVRNAVSMLTDRQRAVADALQKSMSTTGSEWGNEISLKRFGYSMFTEENYFPIETDPNNRIGVNEEAKENDMFRLLNMSATKGLTQGANNALVLHDIFDVYTAHMADMAKYNALALPMLDMLKWYNYIEKGDKAEGGSFETKSVQKSIEAAFGMDAKQYVAKFIRDLNGVKEGGSDGFVGRAISNYKVASVAANLRVGFLQITSLPRAAYVISPKHILTGIRKWNITKGRTSREAVENVGIAQWKALGFYDTSISHSLREMIKHDQSGASRVREASMKLAEWGDSWTMGVLYGAVEAELREKGVSISAPDYKQRLNERMREIIYRTQVVDSTMTRSGLMRQKGLATFTTAFMSEPTLTMNLVADAVFEARMNARAENRRFVPTKAVYKAIAINTLCAGIAALMEAAFTAYRDDDEFEKYWDKFFDALFGEERDFVSGGLFDNLNPVGNIPVISGAIDAMITGDSEGRMDTEGLANLGGGVQALYKAIMEDGSDADLYRGIYKTLSGASQLTGFAASNAMRDSVAAYNTFFAERLDWKRVQTYDNTPTDAAKAIYEALRTGDKALAESLRRRAVDVYGMEEKKINTALAKLVNEGYVAGELDTETASSYLTDEAGKSDRQAETAMTNASYTKDTGLDHADMKADYIAGTITKAQAKEYLKKYDGKTDEEVADKLGEWDYEKTTGRSWADLKADYADGVITASQLRSYLSKYGGLDEEKIEERISDYDFQNATGKESGGPKYWRIPYAYETGGDYGAYIDEAFDEIMYGGEKEKSWKQARSQIASSIASYYKKDYLAVKGTAKGNAMLETILDVYEAIGYDREDQREYIDEKWEEE